jgi:uncharacterized membrane protein YdjX (TVP38/TMEM64 family)
MTLPLPSSSPFPNPASPAADLNTVALLSRLARRRPGLLAVLVLLVGACVGWVCVQDHVSLGDVKQVQAVFAARYAAHPVGVTLLYMATFICLTALCLPGAALLLVMAGASFGLIGGTLVALLASTVGATLTLLASRHLFRRSVEARFTDRLQVINAGLQREGAFYLLSLRLLPVIPFVPVNLLCGVTRMSTWSFFWVSLLGMLPGTAAYVNAGVQVGRIDSLDKVFTPGMLGALVVLAAMPWSARWALKRWQQRARPKA